MLSTNVTFSTESTVKAMYWVIHCSLEKSKKISIDEDGNITDFWGWQSILKIESLTLTPREMERQGE